MILFGNKIVAGVISQEEVMLEVDGPQSNVTGVLIGRQSCGGKDTQGECRVMRKAETGVMQLRAKGCQRSLGSHQKLEEARKDPPVCSRSRRSLSPADTLISDSASRPETLHFCCFKPPSLWYFIKAAPAN